jgi:DNA-binding transcriptional regulator YiaG
VRRAMLRAERRVASLESKPEPATQRGREAAAERLREAMANHARAERHSRSVIRDLTRKQRHLATLRRQARSLDQALHRFHADFPAPVATPPILSGTQIRAARAMLDLSQQALARRAGIGVASLRGLERQRSLGEASPALVQRIVKTLEKAGIELIGEGLYVGAGGPGLRIRRRDAGVGQRRPPAPSRSSAKARKRIKAVA